MLAIITSLLLIAYWLLSGLGIFAALRLRSGFHMRIMLAPALGLAFNIITAFLLSRAGLPIKQVAIPLFIAGLMLVAFFLFSQKTAWKQRSFFLISLFLCGAIIPFAWPFFQFGFEWLGFVNGDMNYYSLSSSRFLNYGYSELPASGNIYDETDRSLAYWYFPNELNHRSGSDLLLAHWVGLSGFNAHQLYMPMIAACHACVAASAGALALSGIRKRSTAFWTMALVALSPMLTLEVTKQLLAQAIGMALLVALCASYVIGMKIRLHAWNLVTILLFSGLAIAYSELVPFFGLFALVFEAARWREWMVPERRNQSLRTIAVLAAGSVLLLNAYLIEAVKFILLSAGGSFKSGAMTMQADGVSSFPQFFLPSSGAMLWGWVPFGNQGNAVAIVIGLVAALLFPCIFFLRRIRCMPAAQMSAVMIAVAAVMYLSSNGFGLFKIAMFIQPFLLTSVAAFITLFFTNRLLRRFGFGLLSASFIPAQFTNVARVSGELGQTRVPYVSTGRIGEQLREIGSAARGLGARNIYSDTPSRELAFMEAYYFKGILFSTAAVPSRRQSWLRSAPDATGSRVKLSGELLDYGEFAFGKDGKGPVATFTIPRHNIGKPDYLLTTSNEFSPINRYGTPPGKRLSLSPFDAGRNHLMFRQSSLGTSYPIKRSGEGDVAMCDVEADPMFKGRTMNGVGRYHLYEVIGAQAGSRTLLSLSASMQRNEDFLLPAVKVLGSSEVSLPLVGRGSARVISGSVAPREIAGEHYLGMDFGRDGTYFNTKRTGPMSWFGTGIKLDGRKIVGFARDISYIAPEQYDNLARPQIISKFPGALEDPGLEYSGIFEDGWISDIAYAVLKAPAAGDRILQLTALIPDIQGMPFSTVLTLKINDKVVHQGEYGKGETKISIPLDQAIFKDGLITKVQIESSALQRLPGGDSRPISMRVDSLGYLSK